MQNPCKNTKSYLLCSQISNSNLRILLFFDKVHHQQRTDETSDQILEGPIFSAIKSQNPQLKSKHTRNGHSSRKTKSPKWPTTFFFPEDFVHITVQDLEIREKRSEGEDSVQRFWCLLSFLGMVTILLSFKVEPFYQSDANIIYSLAS